jgi:hypothetical protein
MNSFTLIVLCLLLIVFPGKVKAQEVKSDIGFNLTLAHFTGTSKELDYPPKGYYTYPINPGIEILYRYKLTNWISVGTGACYQTGQIPAYLNRFKFDEFSIPLLFRFVTNPASKSNVFLSTAIYAGKILYVSADNYGKIDWHKLELKYIQGYSPNSFFVDLSLYAGISSKALNQSKFSVSPVVKFRVKENWMENYRKSMYYGIIISYQLNLKRPQKI